MYSRMTTALVLLGGMSLFAQVAQTPTGTLAGTLYDQAGARLEQASITLRNAETGATRATSPNERGEYRFDNLALGKYSVRASAKSLTTVQIDDILIQSKKTVNVNVTLPEAASTPISVVEVSEAPAPVGPAPAPPPETQEDAKTLDPKIVVGELNAIKERLALSAGQQTKIRAVLQDRQLQVAALRADNALTMPVRREKIKAVRAAADVKLRALLNEDQLDEYDQILKERRERTAQRQQETAQLPH
jgi:hypothetical protein